MRSTTRWSQFFSLWQVRWQMNKATDPINKRIKRYTDASGSFSQWHLYAQSVIIYRSPVHCTVGLNDLNICAMYHCWKTVAVFCFDYDFSCFGYILQKVDIKGWSHPSMNTCSLGLGHWSDGLSTNITHFTIYWFLYVLQMSCVCKIKKKIEAKGHDCSEPGEAQ